MMLPARSAADNADRQFLRRVTPHLTGRHIGRSAGPAIAATVDSAIDRAPLRQISSQMMPVGTGTKSVVVRGLTRCARPTLTSRKLSTYTVLGLIGYVVASGAAGIAATAWGFTLGERLIGELAPPLAFLAAMAIARAVTGRERIAFYQTAFAGVVGTALVADIAGVRVAPIIDLATLGIGTFLVFGRIGCFAAACCHGTLGHGVVYGANHVAIGFWARWEGRALWPVQLIESAASAALVIIAALSGTRAPGIAAVIYITGYGVARFGLELLRGDATRPYLRGASEAQWLALISVAACAIWHPHVLTLAAVTLLTAAMVWLLTHARYRELLQPPHLRELDDVCRRVLADPKHARRETSLGVAMSCYAMPDHRIDWVFSSTHPAWSIATARRIAVALWQVHEIVEGRAPGIIHIIVPSTGVPAELLEDDPLIN